MIELAREQGRKLAEGGRMWLFLDYDGTLAPFAPTPDTILPDEELIDLLERLARYPDCLRVVIMSGRRYSHILKLLPIKGILLAGTYGIEFQTWEGEHVRLLDFESERPFLDQVKAQWTALVGSREDLYIEDKGYSLALHARLAPEKEARQLITDAASAAHEVVDRGTFRILGGHKFIEVAPIIADKGQSVSTLLKRFPWPGATLVYIGDDDKDEAAFKVILQNEGWPILVAEEERTTLAQARLENPTEVRRWLEALVEELEKQAALGNPNLGQLLDDGSLS